MTTTTFKTKQTAGNNADLARVKAYFHPKVYKTVMMAYDAEGREAAKAYVGLFFNDEARAEGLASLFPDAQ